MKATVVSLVLTVTMAQSAGWICSAWCVPQGDDHACCQRDEPSTPAFVKSRTSCDPAAPLTTAMIREETNRASAPCSALPIATGASPGPAALLLCRVRLPGDGRGRSHPLSPSSQLRI